MSRAFVLAATDRIIVGCNDTLEEEGMSGLGTPATWWRAQNGTAENPGADIEILFRRCPFM